MATTILVYETHLAQGILIPVVVLILRQLADDGVKSWRREWRGREPRPVRTGVPPRVTSVTSTTPRAVVTSIRRPARVATIS